MTGRVGLVLAALAARTVNCRSGFIAVSATAMGVAEKIGVVAVARKLLIALWKYLEQGELPAGAEVVDWQSKVDKSAGKKAVA